MAVACDLPVAMKTNEQQRREDGERRQKPERFEKDGPEL